MAKDKRDVEIGLHRNLHLTHLVKEKNMLINHEREKLINAIIYFNM